MKCIIWTAGYGFARNENILDPVKKKFAQYKQKLFAVNLLEEEDLDDH
jgi:hypothetical protein